MVYITRPKENYPKPKPAAAAPETKFPLSPFRQGSQQDVAYEPWARIVLSNGGHALISVVDWELVMTRKWWSCKTSRKTGRPKFYIMSGGPDNKYLHRLIARATKGQQVDHVNGDTMDNRRENLRIVTRQQNAQNRDPSTFARGTSKYRGVSWEKRRRRWEANIYANGKQHYLGQFKDEEAAARAYDAASERFYGRLGTRNFKESL